MAIKYYCGLDMLASIDLNQNQLVKPRIENLATSSQPAANDSVSGQIYYNTNNNELRLFNGTAWVALAASGGGVTQLSIGNASVNSGGVNTSLSLNASTGALTLTPKIYGGGSNIGMVPTGGSAGKYLDGTGAWVDVSTGDVTGVSAGDGIIVTNGSGPVPTVAVKYTGAADNLIQAAANQESQDIETNDVIIYSDSDDSDVINRGLVSDLPFTNNTGTVESIATTSPIEGGTITGSGTISHATQSQTNTTPSSSLSFGGTFTALSANVGVNSTGHVTGQTLTTFTLPSNPNTNTTYTLPTTNGNNPDLVLTGSDSSTDIVNMNGDANTVSVTGSTNNTITFDLVDDVTITNSLTISGSGAAALNIASGKAQTAATTGSDPDATLTTKGYVDGLVTGGLTFKGTFRADTGEILSGDNDGSYIYNCPGGAGTRVAVAVGDYYVVATAGGSFYCSGDTLDIGDSIIGVSAAAADSSTSSDWSIVQSDEGVVSFTNSNGGTYVAYGTVNTNATGAVTIGDVDLTAVDGTATTSTRFLSKDNKWAVPAYTTNTDAKYTLQANAKSGSNVPLFLDGTDGGSDSTVNLTEGTGITLTRNSSTQITIEADNNGTVESVALSMPSAFSVAGSPITSSGTFTVTGAGTTSQYVDGTGALQTFPSIPQGDVTKVIPSTANAKLGISVDNQGGPIPEVGLSISTLTDIGDSSNLADEDVFPFFDEGTNTNKSVSLRFLKDYITDTQSFATTLTSPTSGGSPYTVTHSLASYDVIVQLYGDTSKETIYACVDRTSTNALSITFDSSVGQDVRVLVSRVTNE